VSPFDSGLMFGMRIVESPHIVPVPKIQVSPSFKWCSEECRREMNAFLLDTFGTKEVAYIIDSSYLSPLGFPGRGMDTLVVNPKHVAMLRGLASR
jgi:hypothetical protein